MGKYKYLLKNLGIMTLSNFGSKILSFLMVPLYTRVLTTEEYGMYDFYVTTILLLTPLLSMNILDAVIRFALEKNSEPEKIFTIGFKFCFRAIMLCSGLILINQWTGSIELFTMYPIFFLLYFSLSMIFDLFNQFARGLERLYDVAVAGVINTFVLVSLNALFLIGLKLGLTGYFAAYCCAFAMACLYLAIRIRVWRYFDVSALKRSNLQRDMVKYSAPMILQNIGAWINNLSSRYVITAICGSAANGVFSVAYKIPSLMLVFQTIFNQAWTISAVKSQEDDRDEFYDRVYRVYNLGFVILCSCIIAVNKIVARILFSDEFYDAWRYAPFLIISVIFNSLAGLLGGILIAQKKTNLISMTTLSGAVVNLSLNIVFVKIVGPIGAAIGSLISYIVVWGVRLDQTIKWGEIQVGLKKDISSYFVLVAQAFAVLTIEKSSLLYLTQILCLCIVLAIYRQDVKEMLDKVLKIVASKKSGRDIDE